MIKYSASKVILVTLITGALGAMWFVYNAYVPLYLQGGNASLGAESQGIPGFGLSPSATGFIMTLDNILVLFLGPFVGIWSDGLKSKLGRRLPFVLYSMPFMVVGLLGAAFIPGLIPAALNGNVGALMYLFIPFILSLMAVLLANSFMVTPAAAMIYDWTPSEKRTTATAIVLVVGFLTSVVVLFSSSALYDIFPPLPFLFVAVLLLISVTWVYFAMRGTPEPENVEESNQSPKQIVAALRGLPRERGISLSYLATSDILNGIGFAILQAFLTSYAVSKLNMDVGAAGGLMLIYLIINTALAFPAVTVNNRFGRRRTRLLGFALIAVACLLMVMSPSTMMIYITLLVISTGATLAGIGNMPMWVDHMPSDKFMATIMSMQYFTTTLSAVIGPNVSGWIVQAGGNDYSLIWPVSFGFMLVSLLLTFPVKFGEAHKEVEVTATA